MADPQMLAQNSPLDAALAFIRAIPDEFRNEFCSRLVWLEPREWAEIHGSYQCDINHEALFFSRHDPEAIPAHAKEGTALKLRAFITYLIEYAASEALRELQENLYESAKFGGVKDADVTYNSRKRAHDFYRELLPVWRELCRTGLSDEVIRAFGREVWLERQHNV